MKLQQHLSKFFFILLLCMLSCQNDDDYNSDGSSQEQIPDTFSEYFGNDISRDFLGNVIDTNNNPIEGVSITIGNQTVQTDSNGIFMINNANVKERFGYVKAEKAGYIHGSRSVLPSTGTNKVTIMLLEEIVTGTVNSGSSGNVTSTDGSSVSFDGNFVKEDGSVYSGSVDVIIHHLDPSDGDMSLQMPGMLYAENEDGAERMLQTMGMLAVELRGSNGEDLNLAEGSTSEIQIPVDASLLSSAPATIPLWHFDEANGYWKEEGQATLEGNMYVGTVSHFSFWNLDAQFPAVNLCITLVDENGNPLANQSTSLTHSNPDYLYPTSYGYTDDLGSVCGLVPLNEALEFNVFSYDACGINALHTETVGPFNADSSITVVVMLNGNTDVIQETVTGTFNTCNGDPISDGYVQLRYGTQTFTDVVSNGDFEINVLRCNDDDNNTFTLKGSDYVNLQTTDNISYTFTTPITNIGNISACNTVTDFIEYTIDDGDSFLIINNIFAHTSIQGPNPLNSLAINITGSSSVNCFLLFGSVGENNPEGTYDNLDMQANDDIGFSIAECLDISETNNNIIYNLTAIGEVGEYIDINFSGSYEDFNGIPHTITGIVHVLRDQ